MAIYNEFLAVYPEFGAAPQAPQAPVAPFPPVAPQAPANPYQWQAPVAPAVQPQVPPYGQNPAVQHPVMPRPSGQTATPPMPGTVQMADFTKAVAEYGKGRIAPEQMQNAITNVNHASMSGMLR